MKFKEVNLTILLTFSLFTEIQAQLNDTTSIKPYKEYDHNNRLVIDGYLKNGKEDSIWTFYNSQSEVLQKYDFRKKELIYVKLTEKESKTKYAIAETNFKEVILDRPPIYIGGEILLYSQLASEIKYPARAQRENKSGRVEIGFFIDKDGSTSNYKLLKKAGYGMDEEAMRVVKLMNSNWVPAIYNGKPVGVEYVFPVIFKLN